MITATENKWLADTKLAKQPKIKLKKKKKRQNDAKGSSILSVHLTKNNKRRVILDLRKMPKLSIGKDCKTPEQNGLCGSHTLLGEVQS